MCHTSCEALVCPRLKALVWLSPIIYYRHLYFRGRKGRWFPCGVKEGQVCAYCYMASIHSIVAAVIIFMTSDPTADQSNVSCILFSFFAIIIVFYIICSRPIVHSSRSSFAIIIA